MRILIASSVSPYSASQEMYWAHILERKLRQQGFQVDMFMLPVVADPLMLPEQMVAYRLLDLMNSSHLLLTVGYPAFILRHPHKRVLLFSLASHLHQWYNTEYGVLSSPQYECIRKAVVGAEKQCLAEAERIVCASSALASHLRQVHKLTSMPMILDDNTELNKTNSRRKNNEFWLVCESTLEPFERMDLLLAALAHSQEAYRLRLFIPSASDVYYRALEQQIERLQLMERITIIRAALLDVGLEDASALVSLPFYGMRIPDVVLNAIKCNLPIVTTSDSLALLEVVEHKQNGLVTEPSAHDLAQAMDRLCMDEKLLNQLSKGKRNLIGRLSGVDLLVKNLMK